MGTFHECGPMVEGANSMARKFEAEPILQLRADGFSRNAFFLAGRIFGTRWPRLHA